LIFEFCFSKIAAPSARNDNKKGRNDNEKRRSDNKKARNDRDKGYFFLVWAYELK